MRQQGGGVSESILGAAGRQGKDEGKGDSHGQGIGRGGGRRV